MQLLLAASAQVMSCDLLVLASLGKDVGCCEAANCAANPAIAKMVPKNSHRRLSPVYKVWKFDAVMDAGTRNGRDVFSARRSTREPLSVLFSRVARIDGKAFIIRGPESPMARTLSKRFQVESGRSRSLAIGTRASSFLEAQGGHLRLMMAA